MRAMVKRVIAMLVGLAATGMLLPAVHAEPVMEPALVRRVDYVGIPRPELDTSRKTATAILRDSGIRAEWTDCSATKARVSTAHECTSALAASEVVVRILTTPGSFAPAPEHSLGFSYVNAAGPSVLASIFADAVATVAARTRVDPGVLLGRVVAHEVGHLLLGTPSHSVSGLMRAEWTDVQMQRNLPRDWIFSDHDGRQLQHALALRRERAGKGVLLAELSPP
jgi:hypothetical protein